MALGNKVLFEYHSNTGLPSYPDPDTIYFLENKKEIYVGSKLLANVNTGDVTTESLLEILEAYQVKSIIFQGSGNNVSDISFDSTIGRVTVTRTNLPVLSVGAATTPQNVTLSPGDTFDTVTSTSVEGHTIYDGKTRFRLPDQIVSITISKSSGNGIVLTLVSSDGTTSDVTFNGFGSAAFANTTDFATAAQGQLAAGAMKSDYGTATNATIGLLRDPTSAMDAATKQYVDAQTSGGIASRHVTAGEGLTGGGALSSDVTISHATKTSSDVTDAVTPDLNVVGAVSYDKFGHVTSVGKKDLTSKVNELISSAVSGGVATVTSVTLSSIGWTEYDTIYKYSDVHPTATNTYYQVNLDSDTSVANSIVAANADIHAKIESNQIVLYCYGTKPNVNLKINIIEIPVKSGLALSYDFGEESLVTPAMLSAIESRVSSLETGLTNNVLYARNISIVASRWINSGNTSYPYQATINMQNVDSTYFPVVEFEDSDIDMYELSPTSTTGNNSVTIYCKTKPTTSINIPIVTCYKGTLTTAS